MSINNEIYETLGDGWYTAWDNPVALLRQESKIKAPWIIDRIRANFPADEALRILDIGCGAGFLSNRLAQEKHEVHGLDLSPGSLEVARRHDATGKVRYLAADAYQLPYPDGTFHVVTAMDFLEHVDDPGRIIAEASRVLAPGGLFFYHTFNRSPLSHLVVIKFVEWFIVNTPKRMHVPELFLKPAEVARFCADSGLQLQEVTGIRPVLSSVSWNSLRTRTVARKFRFVLTRSLAISYLGYARRTV